jgi:hypothetical protein
MNSAFRLLRPCSRHGRPDLGNAGAQVLGDRQPPWRQVLHLATFRSNTVSRHAVVVCLPARRRVRYKCRTRFYNSCHDGV